MASQDQKSPLHPSFPQTRISIHKCCDHIALSSMISKGKKKSNNELIFQTQTLEEKTKVSHLDVHWLTLVQEPVFKHHSVIQNTMN